MGAPIPASPEQLQRCMTYVAKLKRQPSITTVRSLVLALGVGELGALDFLHRMKAAGYGKLTVTGSPQATNQKRRQTIEWAEDVDPRQICQKFLSKSPNAASVPKKYRAVLYGREGGGKTRLAPPTLPAEDTAVMALELMRQAENALTLARRILKGRT